MFCTELCLGKNVLCLPVKIFTHFNILIYLFLEGFTTLLEIEIKVSGGEPV